MKILVPIKRVVDHTVKIRVKTDHTGVETQNVKMSINPFDEIAIEAGLQLREQGHASEVIVVSIGDKTTLESLRQGLALGADRAIHIETAACPEPLDIAKILKAIALREHPGLIILGKQAIDDDCNQVGQMLAGLLDWPQGTFISSLLLKEDRLFISREVDGGIENLSLKMPAVITTDLRLNQPRYASLPNVMKAKQKPLEVLEPATLGINLRAHQQTLSIKEPSRRQASGIKVSTVTELVEKLRLGGHIN